MRPLLPIACNQLATLIFGIIGLKLISRFVPPAVNGSYSLFVTLTQLGLLITHSGVLNHATRYWQRETPQAGSYARFLWTMICQKLRILTLLLLLISAGVSFFNRELIWIWVFPFLVFSNFATVLNLIGAGVLNAGGKHSQLLLLGIVSNAARTLLPIGLAILTSMTILVLSIGYTVHGLVVVGCLFLMFRWVWKSAPSTETAPKIWIEELKEYGRPFLWMGIGGWMLQYVDRWIVYGFFGKDQAGLFAYASNIGAIIPTLVVGGLMQLVFPAIFRQADEARTGADWQRIAKRCDRVTLVFLGLTVSGLVLLAAIGPYLVGLLISKNSQNYAPALQILLPAGLAMVTPQINQFYFLLLQGQHNSAGMVRIMLTIAGMKTAGSIIAASISWTAFLYWLIASLILAGLIGRSMIQSLALKKHAVEFTPGKTDKIKS